MSQVVNRLKWPAIYAGNDEMARSLTKSGFAKFMRVNPSQITRWLARGMPLAPDGGIDPVAGKEWVERHIDGTKRIYVQADRAHVQRRAVASRRTPEPQPEDDPVGTAANIVLIWLSRKLPAAIARLALDEGSDRDFAERLYRLADRAATEQALAIMEWAGRPHPEGWSMPPAEPMPAAEEGAA